MDKPLAVLACLQAAFLLLACVVVDVTDSLSICYLHLMIICTIKLLYERQQNEEVLFIALIIWY